MPLTITHEGVAYDLDDVDLQWTLEECRGALATRRSLRILGRRGLRSRLRADAANRELAAIPEAAARRAARSGASTAADADATDRSLTVGDVDVTVLIVDD
ncbi:hypothetical protein JL720_4388 [Aureococcus anophagefferens]|nr:hypothetical protein JL720_4388 [Aureococcus anophagefferens]